MQMLVLGGTAWLGRQVAEQALARGHEVTCLARGTAPAPPGATFVRADRDRDDALAPVADHVWDTVVDVAMQPGHVRRAVRDLRARHRVLVSTVSVYAPSAQPDLDETAPVVPALEADSFTEMSDYGAAKVACEEAVLAAGVPAAVVRAGLIGGPGDETGRTGYWPWRFAHPSGPDVLVPDDPDLPTDIVDVRDLATWLVRLAEEGTDGVLNGTGEPTTLGEVLDLSAEVASEHLGRHAAPPRPVAPARLLELGVAPWAGPCSMPLWVPDREIGGFARWDTTRSRAAGLVTRPLAQTLCDVLTWEETGRTSPRRAGLTDEDERRLRAALDAG